MGMTTYRRYEIHEDSDPLISELEPGRHYVGPQSGDIWMCAARGEDWVVIYALCTDLLIHEWLERRP